MEGKRGQGRTVAGQSVSPPPARLRHPLEENIFTSLIITIVAVLVSVVGGFPLLLLTGAVLLVAIGLRYILLGVHGLARAISFGCTNRIRNTPPDRTPPPLVPRNRLAAGNDIRWIRAGSKTRVQPVIQTLLLLEGSIQLQQLRTLLLTRVLGATANGDLIYPRLTQKLNSRLGGYVWETDPEFAIQNHVFAGPASLDGEDELQAYVGNLFKEELDPNRPLWDLRLIVPYGPLKDSLLLVRTHMALADGSSLLRILTESLADRQTIQPMLKPTFGAAAFSFNLLRSLIVGPLTLAIWLLSTRKDANPFRHVPKDDVKHKEKPEYDTWQVAWSAALSVPQVSRVKQIMRSSFNDVLLSAAAGSMRKFLQEQGISYPPNLKAVIPVDLRSTSPAPKRQRKRLGWKAASILTLLPTGLEGAIPRLWATRQRLDEVRASADPVVAYGTTAILMNILPQRIGGAVLNSITNKASVQVASAQGPHGLVGIGGFVLKGIYPFVPAPGDLRLSLTLFSYADQVHVTALAHPSLKDAPVALLRGINIQMDQLSRQLSQRKVPGESRRLYRQATTLGQDIQNPPTHQLHVKLQVVQEELQQIAAHSNEPEETRPQLLNTRFNCLKDEYTELMGELRRRSSIVDGVYFEDEETVEEFRKPRKRALSVVSVSARRSSLFPPGRNVEPSDSLVSLSEDSPSSPSSQSRNTGPPPPRSPIRTTAV